MRLAAARLVSGSACAFLFACGGGDSAPAPSSFDPFGAGRAAAGDLAADDRIAWLLAPCPHPEPFLDDTGDPVAILVSKLSSGELDPLRQAKTELSEMGEPALPELRRYSERQLADPGGAQRLLNALTVVSAMKTSAGRDILLAALGHPQDTVRLEAIRGLSVHAAPEDYDRLLGLVPISSPEALNEIGHALATADRARAEAEYVAWLAGPRERPGVWIGAAERFCDTDRPAILERFRELWPRLDGEVRYYLAAAVARTGDEAALTDLRSALEDDNSQQRTFAVRALDRVGLTREFAPLLWKDRDETLRGMIARAISEMPRSAETDGWLRKGILDRARSVRIVCLRVLAERNDPEACDQALALLEGSRSDLEYGIQVLRSAWEKNPPLAERSLSVLMGLRSGSIQPVRVETPTLDRAIAQIPLVEATRDLYERARTTPGEVDGMPAHRWFLMQAGNTGPQGRTWLRENWDDEIDPAWRVDIVMAATSDKDERSREFLLRVLDHERTTPLEMLHAANLLAHHGPTATVAPRLKRAALRISDPQVRPAFNCLLARWYGRAG